jgi:PAS domain S-box-containing protein
MKHNGLTHQHLRLEMKPTSRPNQRLRLTRLATLTLGFAAAIILPWVGTNISAHTPSLHGTPLALSFASVATITIFTGLWPGITGSLANALIFNYCAISPAPAWSYSRGDIIRSIVIFFIGLLITFICQRQRSIGDRLRIALASLQARTDALIEAQQSSNSATWTYDAVKRHTHWTEGGAQVFGRPFAEIDSLSATINAIAEEDRDRFLSAVDHALQTGEIFLTEFRVPWPNGEVHWLESRGKPSPTNPEVWRGVTIDISERKNTENALVRSEKLAAIGRLSATIAHEINNPLEAVTNLLYLASADHALAPGTKRYLRDADRELARLANIVRRTLTFVRPKSPIGPADLTEVVESIVAMFLPRCTSRGARILFEKACDLQVAVPSDDLWQILTNLVSNACDALTGPGGLIEICTLQENESAAIYIRDNGSGIAAEDVDRIFDPFFTTKQDVGTGIGLWVTKDLVEKNGGHISVNTGNLPSGFRTEFRIEFPLARLSTQMSRQEYAAASVYNQDR